MIPVSYIRCCKELLCLHHARVGVAIMKCSYARGSRGWKQQYNPDRFRTEDDLEHLERDNDHQMDDPELIDKIIREEERRRKIVKFKIIERKSFKKPKEVNLLTWDAKEQIRYLHNEFPTEWTIERLAESFPISHDGIIKLLKSKYAPRTVQEIIHHDEKVQKNWASLKSKSDSRGGPIMNRYLMLLKEGRLYTLANAGGIASLPKPEMKSLLPGELIPKSEVPGVYESIVKAYCEKKAKQKADTEISKPSDTELYTTHKEDSQKFLADITTALVPKSQIDRQDFHRGKVTVYGKSAAPEVKSVDYGTFASKEDSSVSMGESDVISSEDIRTMLDASLSNRNQLPITSRRRLRRPRNMSRSTGLELEGTKPTEDVPDQLKLQMQGTGKISDPETELSEDVDHLENLAKENSSIGLSAGVNQFEDRDGPDKAMLDALQYDRDTDIAYIFDEDSGYQHPFGKAAEHFHKIEIPKHMEGKGKLFKKGQNYYDDDGEFLFRVPGQE